MEAPPDLPDPPESERASSYPARRARRRAARSPRIRWRRVWLAVGVIVLLGLGALVWEATRVFGMPGESHRGPLPPLTDEQARLRDDLRRDLEHLAGEIGERNMFRLRRLRLAEAFLEDAMTAAGHAVERQGYDVRGTAVHNLAAEIRGADASDEILVVGAHYDTVHGCPGANDNGTGVVALLALARAFAGAEPRRTLRFVCFVNEEPPYFQGPHMGSRVYARGCRQRGETIVGMLSLETIGYYSDEPGSQRYPFPIGFFYPSRGNFISFVGNRASRDLVRRVVGSFRRQVPFPSEGAALPGFVSAAGWSDHWSFWEAGYPGLMVTDTAPFRYSAYHTPADTVDKIDFERLARVVDGLRVVIADLAGIDG